MAYIWGFGDGLNMRTKRYSRIILSVWRHEPQGRRYKNLEKELAEGKSKSSVFGQSNFYVVVDIFSTLGLSYTFEDSECRWYLHLCEWMQSPTEGILRKRTQDLTLGNSTTWSLSRVGEAHKTD